MSCCRPCDDTRVLVAGGRGAAVEGEPQPATGLWWGERRVALPVVIVVADLAPDADIAGGPLRLSGADCLLSVVRTGAAHGRAVTLGRAGLGRF
jgi:hypothetical protein